MFVLVGIGVAGAQGFLAPIGWPPTDADVYVVLDDGTRVEGHIGSFTTINGKPRYAIVGAAGAKHRFGTWRKPEPDEISEARIVEAGVLLGKGLARQASASVSEAIRNAGASVVVPEWLVFDRVPWGVSRVLLAPINPGFATRLRVYADPDADKATTVGLGGIAFSGGGPLSYQVWKAGEPGPIRVEKREYDERWAWLFGDCPPIPKPDPLKWSEFETHVYLVETACGPSTKAFGPTRFGPPSPATDGRVAPPSVAPAASPGEPPPAPPSEPPAAPPVEGELTPGPRGSASRPHRPSGSP